MVNGKGLVLLLLLGGDVFLNPGPLTLGVLNARSIRNKGPLLANMVATNDLDFLCMETHIYPFDSDSFLQPVTFFLTSLVPQVSVVVLVFSLDPPTDPIKSGFMAIHRCLPASTSLKDHVLVTFWKNSCHLWVTCHLLILHIISVAISTFMLMFQLVMVIDSLPFLIRVI